jgi:hypothetical protein
MGQSPKGNHMGTTSSDVSSEVLNTFRKARELLSSPKRWTKGASARDIHGIRIDVTESKITEGSFCLRGALIVSSPDFAEDGSVYRDSYWRAEKAIEEISGDEYELTYWNDLEERKHEEVLAVLDKCIAQLAPQG